MIKEALSLAPTLVSPDFSKDFILYAYGSWDAISAVLVQKNDEGYKQSIAFYSKGLESYEQCYSFVEKHAFGVIKSLKKFRHLLSKNKVQLIVSHQSVKDLFLNKDLAYLHEVSNLLHSKSLTVGIIGFQLLNHFNNLLL